VMGGDSKRMVQQRKKNWLLVLVVSMSYSCLTQQALNTITVGEVDCSSGKFKIVPALSTQSSFAL